MVAAQQLCGAAHGERSERRVGQGHGTGKSQVSRLCAEMRRPLEGEWPYLWLDATYMSLETIAPLSHDLSVSLPLIAA